MWWDWARVLLRQRWRATCTSAPLSCVHLTFASNGKAIVMSSVLRHRYSVQERLKRLYFIIRSWRNPTKNSLSSSTRHIVSATNTPWTMLCFTISVSVTRCCSLQQPPSTISLPTSTRWSSCSRYPPIPHWRRWRTLEPHSSSLSTAIENCAKHNARGK